MVINFCLDNLHYFQCTRIYLTKFEIKTEFTCRFVCQLLLPVEISVSEKCQYEGRCVPPAQHTIHALCEKNMILIACLTLSKISS